VVIVVEQSISDDLAVSKLEFNTCNPAFKFVIISGKLSNAF